MSRNGYTAGWNEARVEQMTTLWSDGFSAGMIAREMGGFEASVDGGRCAVIGKLYRLGLVGSGEKPRYTLPRGKGHRMVKSGVSQTRPVSVARIRTGQKRLARVVAAEPPAAPRSLSKSLVDLQSGECKWPYGDGPYTFCANPVQPGSTDRDGESELQVDVYCPWHRSVAFTKGTQRDFDRVATRCLGGKLHASKTFVLEA